MRSYLVPCLSFACALGLLAVDATSEASGGGDYFGGVLYSASTSKPQLAGSSVCVAERDYSIEVRENGHPITALAIHGGGIEPKTDLIVDKMREARGYNTYKFVAHPSQDGNCESAEMLHVTASNFDEPSAVALVENYPASVAIHGYGDRHLRNPQWTPTVICVGGVNRDNVVNRFVAFVEENRENDPRTIEIAAVDARKGVDAYGRCPAMQGSGGRNIVNRNQNGSGLQLEFSNEMRGQLASDDPQFAPIQKFIFDAIEYALAEYTAAAQ